MSLIDVKNLSFSYYGGYGEIFENASFQIDTDWKLGLIGRNGRGKTTFLNLLAGKYEYEGKISSGVKFVYFPFEVKDKTRLTREVVFGINTDAEEWRIYRELSLLGVDEGLLYRPFDTLSGGEQTKILLAALFLNENDFMLIDEPTNHLDGEARRAVAEYLRRKKSFILVSHDRDFLDGCVDHILAINRKNIEVTSGNFSVWFENFKRRQAFETTQNERLQRDISKLKETAARTAVWADKTEKSKYGKASSGLKQDKGFVGHKAAKMMQRAKSAENRFMRAAEQKSQLLQNVETEERLKLNPLEYRTEKLLSVCDMQIYYGDNAVFEPLTFSLSRGERVALDGGNGSGKSSVLKLIVGEKIERVGAVTLGSGLKISFVPQSAEGLSGNLSDYARERGIDESLFKAILSKTGFEKSQFEGDISAFSQGQKKKVLIAASLCERAHIYIWDEPLNYIDIFSRIQIEKLICEFKPTMLFVEHDAAFRRAVATKTVKLKKAGKSALPIGN